jgi:hypothetical protein
MAFPAFLRFAIIYDLTNGGSQSIDFQGSAFSGALDLMLSEPVPFPQGLHGNADFRLPQARSRFDILGRSLVLILEKCYDAGQGSFHAQALQAQHEQQVLFVCDLDSDVSDDASSYASDKYHNHINNFFETTLSLNGTGTDRAK